MESLDNTTDHVGGPYPEEIILDAYNLEWKSIELRRKRLQKSWQHLYLMHKMEQEDRRYQRELRKLKRQEQEKKAREQIKRQREEILRRQREKERAAAEKQKRRMQVAESGKQTDEDESAEDKKVKKTKSNSLKTKTQTNYMKKTKKTKPKRIAPISLPSSRPEDDESTADESQKGVSEYDSPAPELPDDGLLDLLSLDKGSDSDVDDEPSMVSLILPAAQDSPQPSPLKKKTLTPQKRFTNKRAGLPLDFNFTNAEARRQAKAAEAAEDEQYRNEEGDVEPEPMPAPSIPTPKKRLKRRKEAVKDRQIVRGANASEGKKLMAAMAKTTVAIKPKKAGASREAAVGTNVMRKKQVENGKVSKGSLNKAKNAVEVEKTTPGLSSKKNKTEPMSIKQRLANAELLAQMRKMEDMNTPKVLGKKIRKAQKQGVAKTLAAERAGTRKVSSSDAADAEVSQPDQMEEGDLNISLNSSGLISDNDSSENVRASTSTRKRPREAVQGDVTPAKKLQFLEITKRLAKSPMPRFLRTPTPLASPAVPSAAIRSKVVSPAPRTASASNTTLKDHGARRMNSSLVKPKKTTNANQFAAPIGASVGAGGGGFSMFDAFVNSGSSGAIPRLKTKAGGNV